MSNVKLRVLVVRATGSIGSLVVKEGMHTSSPRNEGFYSLHGDKGHYARGYLRDDIRELCEFTRKIRLGVPS